MKPKSEVERIKESLTNCTSPDTLPLDTRQIFHPRWRESTAGGSSEKRVGLLSQQSTFSPGSKTPQLSIPLVRRYEPYADGYE